ncbi:MAG: diguanylate cyclase [Alphaproteobacteria bacterium]|jgi:two-component system cell cycle response regulator|nr:diguanylate cyclase [Alphaproteobacteria bacterium]
MPGDILIVDNVATNRIVLKVKLLAAQHRVRPCESIETARAEIRQAPPDLVILDVTSDTAAALEFCQGLKDDPDTALIPVIATGGFLDPEDRVRALRAGADDVLGRPLNDQILQARIRSLLRARDAHRELRLREDTRRALGFAEAQAGFGHSATVVALSPSARFLRCAEKKFAGCPNIRLQGERFATGSGLPDRMAGDLLLIDGRDFAMREAELYRLLSELRSRTDTRHAAVLVVLPADMTNVQAMALDLGANDLVMADASAQEVVLRAKNLIADKQRADQLRDTVQTGLQAAVTDPLTGLFNRRYALPHLEKMVDRAFESGRQIAVMVLDIDHFKTINDTYGHAAGDEILQQVAGRLRENVRAVDLLARIGGEEFLVAIPESDTDHARNAAQRLCQTISGAPFRLDNGQLINVTMSIGVSLSGPDPDPVITEGTDHLVRAADLALYAAKGSGRNTVSLSAA